MKTMYNESLRISLPQPFEKSLLKEFKRLMTTWTLHFWMKLIQTVLRNAQSPEDCSWMAINWPLADCSLLPKLHIIKVSLYRVGWMWLRRVWGVTSRKYSDHSVWGFYIIDLSSLLCIVYVSFLLRGKSIMISTGKHKHFLLLSS